MRHVQSLESVVHEVRPAIDGGASRRVDADFSADRLPVVTGISGPTSVGDFDHDASIPVGPDVAHGMGAVILMLTETSGLPL